MFTYLTARADIEHHTPPELKTFTVHGAITPAEAGLRFFLPPHVEPLITHIERGTFFMLYGPRGAGKTTTALHALRHVRRKHGWRALTANLNAIPTRSSEAFWTGLCEKLQSQAAVFGVSLRSFDNPASFQRAFSRSTLGQCSPFVLMFDEFDELDASHVAAGIKGEVSMNVQHRGGSLVCAVADSVAKINAFDNVLPLLPCSFCSFWAPYVT